MSPEARKAYDAMLEALRLVQYRWNGLRYLDKATLAAIRKAIAEGEKH